MEVINVHERVLNAEPEQVGALIEGLGSPTDRFWPVAGWPAMWLGGTLAVGVPADGPIRYIIEAHEPRRFVRFRFTAPTGFEGVHSLQAERVGDGKTLLRHVIQMQARGRARLTWPLVFRPLHDALLEDALDRAEQAFGSPPRRRGWPLYVRVLRWALSKRRP